jgi:UDP-N-acetylmuramoyl-L-alanyl-D-glutamate--2,6-diaminopimelate ligase
MEWAYMLLDIEIKGITCDSRKVKPGYAFVAIKGEKVDGHSFIGQAIEKGASVIYTEDDLHSLPVNIPVIKVENSRSTLARLLAKFYDYPSEKMNMIGVTGTNGKTTTTFMIETIFREAGFVTGLIGTVAIKVGDRYFPHSLTTPDSEYLQKVLADMVEQKSYVTVMEVSSHGLKYCRVDNIDFNVAVHTNITPDHMDTHYDFQDYLNTKRRLFNMLPVGTAAVINTDDPYGVELIKENVRPLIITYGLGAKSSITASSIDISSLGTTYTCCVQRSFTNMLGNDVEPQEIPLKLKVPGKHNIYNSLAATAVALLYGIEPQVIHRALAGFMGVRRRMQTVYQGEFLVIDDFSHNPGSYEAVFETVQTMSYNNLYIVNAIRGGRGTAINRANGDIVANWANLLHADEIIITGSYDSVDEPDLVSEAERQAFMNEIVKTDAAATYFKDLDPALEYAVSKAGRGDIILLLGAQGMDGGQEIMLKKIRRRYDADGEFSSPLPMEYVNARPDKTLHKHYPN